jgi:hypothetical protein
MKKTKNIFKNKSAISTLFIAIYIVIITVILLSALFIGLTLSNSGLLSYQREQQDRNQEKVILSSLSIDKNTNLINTLSVNNTGGITVRIRALYLDKTFVCDPSTLSSADSYIAPQSSIAIPLLSKNIYANSSTLMANWTVTTERGTSTSEIGANLWIGSQEQLNDPEKVYYGPICLYFSQFQWSSNGGASWHAGWTIPENPGNVIWRINITNIDNRPIILDGNSSFSISSILMTVSPLKFLYTSFSSSIIRLILVKRPMTCQINNASPPKNIVTTISTKSSSGIIGLSSFIKMDMPVKDKVKSPSRMRGAAF